MTDDSNLAVTIEHSGRTVDALEWSSIDSKQTVVVAVDGNVADMVAPLAGELEHTYRVNGASLRRGWDAVTVSWWAQEPLVLIAQGRAGELACDAARLAPGAIRALVLADVPPSSANLSGIVVPTLVFHGRDSSAETHAQAVKTHHEIPGSHIIELDGCAELPTKNCPAALAESLSWYLSHLGDPVIEFTDFDGSDAEPVDPKA